jgi:hypothetical protein
MADTSDILDILSLFEDRKFIIPWIGIEVFHGTREGSKTSFQEGMGPLASLYFIVPGT